MAALFLVAAPAVGAPDLGRGRRASSSTALCIVGGDICTQGDARRAGLRAVPADDQDDRLGRRPARSVVELGGKWLVGGHAAVGRDGGGRADGERRSGRRWRAGRLGRASGRCSFEAGAEGAVRARVQAARGWVLPGRATASRFLEHALRNAFDSSAGRRRGADRGAVEVAGSVGADVGWDEHGGRYRSSAVRVGAGRASGVKHSSDGSLTTYSRMTLERPRVHRAVRRPRDRPRAGPSGSSSHGRAASRRPGELVFRTATPGDRATASPRSSGRLDLTRPGESRRRRARCSARCPWPQATARATGRSARSSLNRIASQTSVERLGIGRRGRLAGRVVQIAAGRSSA